MIVRRQSLHSRVVGRRQGPSSKDRCKHFLERRSCKECWAEGLGANARCKHGTRREAGAMAGHEPNDAEPTTDEYNDFFNTIMNL